jgi:DNA-binding HxlR family transcriptional regulator
MGCSVACALNEVGDWWSLLVVKQAMLGTRRFVDFQHSLGIAKNILCNRLSRLVDNGVMVRVDVGEHGKRYEYRLTDKGRDLFTVVTALRQWSERWNGEKDAMQLVDGQSGEPLAPVVVNNQQGKVLTVRDVRFVDEDGKPWEDVG